MRGRGAFLRRIYTSGAVFVRRRLTRVCRDCTSYIAGTYLGPGSSHSDIVEAAMHGIGYRARVRMDLAIYIEA